MCGRFTAMYTWPELVALYNLTLGASNLQPRYNVCPTTTINTVRVTDQGQRTLSPMRWGLIPSWHRKPLKEFKLATFNARTETVEEKSTFKSAFKSQRCLIPVSGYYEWKTEGKNKQPFYFTAADGSPILTIAGLWNDWKDEAGTPLMTCTMMITEPNKFVAQYHDRMPVLLERDQFTDWLGGKMGKEDILRPPAEDLLKATPVSTRVNSSRADDNDATLIEGLTS